MNFDAPSLTMQVTKVKHEGLVLGLAVQTVCSTLARP
jgi:hypothetical protein